MYAAIDGLVDKLDRQIIKHKDKFEEGRRGAAPKRSGPVRPPEPAARSIPMNRLVAPAARRPTSRSTST